MQKIDDEGFINAALKFMEVENCSDKDYDEIVSNFESVASQLPLAEKKLEEKRRICLNTTKPSMSGSPRSRMTTFQPNDVFKKIKLFCDAWRPRKYGFFAAYL